MGRAGLVVVYSLTIRLAVGSLVRWSQRATRLVRKVPGGGAGAANAVSTATTTAPVAASAVV